MFTGLKCNHYDNINSCLDCSFCSIYLFIFIFYLFLTTSYMYTIYIDRVHPSSLQLLPDIVNMYPHPIPFHFNFVTTDSNECHHLECWLDLVQGSCAGIVAPVSFVRAMAMSVPLLYSFYLLACLPSRDHLIS